MADNKSKKTNLTDKRCIKTRQAIRNATIKLLKDRDICNVTITDISKLAFINRKTFYSHYSSATDVVEDIEKEYIENISLIIKKYNILSPGFNPVDMFLAVSNIIKENVEFYKDFAFVAHKSFFRTKLKSALTQLVIQLNTKKIEDGDDGTVMFAIDFMISGVISLYSSWFSDSKNLTLDDLSCLAAELVWHGINRITKSV